MIPLIAMGFVLGAIVGLLIQLAHDVHDIRELVVQNDEITRL